MKMGNGDEGSRLSSVSRPAGRRGEGAKGREGGGNRQQVNWNKCRQT